MKSYKVALWIVGLMAVGVSGGSAFGSDEFPFKPDPNVRDFDCSGGARLAWVRDLGDNNVPFFTIQWQGGSYPFYSDYHVPGLINLSVQGQFSGYIMRYSTAPGSQNGMAFDVRASDGEDSDHPRKLQVTMFDHLWGKQLDQQTCTYAGTTEKYQAAVMRGDLAAVKALHATRPWQSYFPAALVGAVFLKNNTMVDFLLSTAPSLIHHSVRLNTCTVTPISVAMAANNVEMVRKVLSGGFSPHSSMDLNSFCSESVPYGEAKLEIVSLLKRALIAGNLEILEVLAQHGVFQPFAGEKYVPDYVKYPNMAYGWASLGFILNGRPSAPIIEWLKRYSTLNAMVTLDSYHTWGFYLTPFHLHTNAEDFGALAYSGYARDLEGFKAMLGSLEPASRQQWLELRGPETLEYGPQGVLIQAMLAGDLSFVRYLQDELGIALDLTEVVDGRARDFWLEFLRHWARCEAGSSFQTVTWAKERDRAQGVDCSSLPYERIHAAILEKFGNKKSALRLFAPFALRVPALQYYFQLEPRLADREFPILVPAVEYNNAMPGEVGRGNLVHGLMAAAIHDTYESGLSIRVDVQGLIESLRLVQSKGTDLSLLLNGRMRAHPRHSRDLEGSTPLTEFFKLISFQKSNSRPSKELGEDVKVLVSYLKSISGVDWSIASDDGGKAYDACVAAAKTFGNAELTSSCEAFK